MTFFQKKNPRIFWKDIDEVLRTGLIKFYSISVQFFENIAYYIHYLYILYYYNIFRTLIVEQVFFRGMV